MQGGHLGTASVSDADEAGGRDPARIQQAFNKKHEERQIQKQWVSKILKELGITNLGLSERDRTLGAGESLALTHKRYLAAIQNKGQELSPILNRLELFAEGPLEPSKRLEELAHVLARLEELDLDRTIFGDLTLTGQVDAVCSSLKARRKLCRLCFSVSEQLAALPGRLSRIGMGAFWPPRAELGSYPMDSFSDGLRLLPPEKVDEDRDLPFNVIRHHVHGASLLASAKDCPFCELIRMAIILDSFRKYGYPLDKPTSELSKMMLAIRMGIGLDGEFEKVLEGIRNSQNSIYLMVDGNNTEGAEILGDLKVIWQKPASLVGRDGDRKVVFTKLKVYASDSQQLGQYISASQPLRNSGSVEAFSQVNRWLEDCRTHHKWCRDTISHQPLPKDELMKLPTRVIDVGSKQNDHEVRLIETSCSPKAHWVALSHCWGEKKNHPLNTTRANLAQHLTNILVTSLPKTYQDAVVTTRALGLRYLWIDSLCIVQDDEDEWRRESQMMAAIYEHAVITLAASAAMDSTEGLFVQRPYAKIQFPSIQLPFIKRDEHSGRRYTLGNYSVSLDWRQEPFMRHLEPMFSTIYQRGWCTQELILSRRVVHFLDEGMVWVCKRKAVDETGQMIMAGKRHSESDWATEWGRIITEHSMRKFTFEKDRLISLDGLAREVCKANNNSYKPEEYFYGTWLVDMPEHLLWASYRVRDRTTELPSWSWASLASAVWLRFKDFDNMRPDDGLGQDCKILGVDEATGVLTVSAIRMEIGSQWNLKLLDRVPLQSLNEKYGRLAYRQPLVQGYELSSTTTQLTGWIEFDDERDALNVTQPIFYLHLAETMYWEKPEVQYWGLLLEDHPTRKGVFRRVGMASLLDFESLKIMKRQDTAIA